MHPAQARLARLLLCLLFLQWAGAGVVHARILAAAASVEAVEICSHEGRRVLLLDQDGKPLRGDPAQDCCDLCCGPAAVLLPGPDAVARPVAFLPLAGVQGRPGLPPLPPRAPPQQPRAPPLT